MTNTLSSTPSYNKRRIFTSTSSKMIQKYDDGISMTISSENNEEPSNINIISK